ncbi:MAG TPA: hypothetical protein VMB71_11270 [Acetobacteraceae bacterium]|nr:hypothetical protein [Acetobacteraceae bacterium]
MRTLLLAAAACGVLAAASASAQTFQFQTLDNPGDPTFNQLLGINDAGTIVGYFGSGAVGHPNIGYQIAAPYTSYTKVMQPGSTQTQATGINNAGLMTNFWAPTNLGTGDANFGSVIEPVGANFGFVSATDPLTNGVPTVDQALGINNENMAAGFWVGAKGNAHGFVYNLTTSTYTEIMLPGAKSLSATGINDNNEVCGFFTGKSGATVGFVRNATGGVVTHFHVPGTTNTQLLGINNSGVVVGFYQVGNITHGLYYTPSNGNWLTVDDPNGVQGTVVNGVNNKGQLVGFYTDAAGNVHGMLVTVTP